MITSKGEAGNEQDTENRGALLGSAAAAEVAGSAYLYRRTMIRYNAKTERTMKMSGVDWEKYIPMMKERREWMMEQPHEDVWITSHDGLKLHGTYFKGDEGNKAVICFHGYTSEGLNDYGSLSNYYLKHGFGCCSSTCGPTAGARASISALEIWTGWMGSAGSSG